MSNLTIDESDGIQVIEWFEEDGTYIFDLAGGDSANVAAVQLLHSRYDSLTRDDKIMVRSSLRTIVEVLNGRAREVNLSSLLMWLYETVERKAESK